MEVKTVLKNDQGKDMETLAGMSDNDKVDHVLKEASDSFNDVYLGNYC